ncbi:gamma-glutamyltransferase [Merismopedia glauca]|uniref:Glutathione hydrolase proenzyme n=1 Tax=Merismopedia glauca CCAP 1448/3 TaxID=1296344 RepID=A0A2T1C6G8_9CYAN|nr:gamma-glutamyltransferase [Merismopedia glauca]PSB03733.1 gamma-glutamyltransferase [Merismopedia glauca CCAP 1448/3]
MNQTNHGAIAAGHEKTATAGIEMLQLGGNAFDAATAAVLASFVVEPMLTSPAGGGFLLAHTEAGENTLFDFFTQTPLQKRPRSEVEFRDINLNFGGAIQTFHIGKGSIATPGNILGITQVHQKLGKLPFHIVAEPAINYAEKGVEVGEFSAYCLQLLAPIALSNQDSQQIFAPNGQVLQQGDRLVLKDLAETLKYLVKYGCQEFYTGEIAHELIRDCQQSGGYLTLEDLKSYQVIERKPLVTQYRDRQILTNPPPSSGGILLCFALQLLSQTDLSKLEFGSSQHLELLANIMKITNQARKNSYDSHIYQADIAEQFLSSSNLEIYLQTLKRSPNKWGSTTHISVLDEQGNAATVTTSNGEGSGYVIPHTGIMMNNMLGEDDLNPFGFHQWTENCRLSSMMSPTILLKDGQPEIVLGSGGSKRIRTAILQVISNLLDWKMPLSSAISCPRCHWEDDLFNIEFGVAESTINALQDLGEFPINSWNQQNMFFGGVHTVMKTPLDGIIGAGDRRRCGVFLSC